MIYGIIKDQLGIHLAEINSNEIPFQDSKYLCFIKETETINGINSKIEYETLDKNSNPVNLDINGWRLNSYFTSKESGKNHSKYIDLAIIDPENKTEFNNFYVRNKDFSRIFYRVKRLSRFYTWDIYNKVKEGEKLLEENEKLRTDIEKLEEKYKKIETQLTQIQEILHKK